MTDTTSAVENSAEDVGLEAPPCKIPRLEASDIHRTGAKCVGGEQDPKLPGSGHHIVGVLRTKPGRGDPTISMSCSDKLAKWMFVGVQGSLVMNFLQKPIHLSHVVIGKCPYSEKGMQRALFDRFDTSNLRGGDSKFNQIKAVVCQSLLEFKFCKPSNTTEKQPCPSSIVWTACPQKSLEVAVEGRKQGVTKKTQNRPACRLQICKKNLYKSFASLVKTAGTDNLPPHLTHCASKLDTLPYREAKQLASEYCKMWETVRAKVMPCWTLKPANLANFTIQD